MAKTFTWLVEKDVEITIEYRTVEAQFGDGYKQTSADGINTKNEQYVVKVHAREDKAKQIMAFFDEHAGYKSFFWTPPLGTLSLFTCKDPKPNPEGGGLFSITGTFVKAFSAAT